MTSGRILLVDPDESRRDQYHHALERAGHTVSAVGTEVLTRLRLSAARYDVAVVVQNHCLDLLRYTRENHPRVLTVVVEPEGSPESAVGAMKLGAADYISQSIAPSALCTSVKRVLENRQASDDQRPDAIQTPDNGLKGIITQDRQMLGVISMVKTIADTPATVLISGPSGTGKSMIGRAIHAASARRDKPFVEVSCGALSDTLLESELFGHVKGAFTGATSDKPGRFIAADGGTIFLDEIASASPNLQVRLLRVLQDRVLEPVGSHKSATVDVRVILASHIDLAREVKLGRFRQDLFYRVNVVNVTLPALKERPVDIEPLAGHFLARHAEEMNRPIEGFAPDALACMRRYDWPGNVRELDNCVQRAVVLCKDRLIGAADLPANIVQDARPGSAEVSVLAEGKTLKQAVKDYERSLIMRAIDKCGGNRLQASKLLGIDRATLYKKLR